MMKILIILIVKLDNGKNIRIADKVRSTRTTTHIFRAIEKVPILKTLETFSSDLVMKETHQAKTKNILGARAVPI